MKKAKCEECPLKKECLAFRHRMQDLLPKKRPRPETILLERQVAVILCQGHLLLQKGKSGKVMADLYEFPYLDGQCGWECFKEVLALQLKYVNYPGQSTAHFYPFSRPTISPFIAGIAADRGSYLEKTRRGAHPPFFLGA